MDNRSIISKYKDLHHEVLSDFWIKWNPEKSKNFKSDVIKFFYFEKEFDWNILLNALYVIDDTEYAKKNYLKFKLSGPTKILDIGEQYLRLYGILNAVYQQQLAIINLIEIHKIPHKSKIVNDLKKYKIIELRNKIGAHSTNYINNDSKDFDVYEISRIDLENDKILLIRNQDIDESYELESLLSEFDYEIQRIYSIILNKFLKKKNITKYLTILDNIDFEKDGGFMIGNIKIFKPK